MKPKVYLETSVISYFTAPLRKEARQRLRAALAAKGIVCPKLSTPLEFLE